MARLVALLGIVGTIVGIVAGIVGLIPSVQSKPGVRVLVEKAQLYGAPGSGNLDDVREEPADFGSVTVTISNNSEKSIEKSHLRFQHLRHCQGIVVADGTFPRSQFKQMEQDWNKKISADSTNTDDTFIDLPSLGVGDGIKVQVFGSNWKYVDPQFIGASNIQVTWIIGVTDSRVHRFLFEDHGWIWGLVSFILVCGLLAWIAFHNKP